MTDFVIGREQVQDVDVVTVSGEIDIDSGPAVGVVVEACLKGDARAVVLDYTGVSFIDSTGVSLLLRAHRRLAETDRRLAIASDRASASRRMFELTGLVQTLPLADTRDDALRLVAEPRPA